MALGKLKWFDETAGYGFISPNDGGKDLFAHFSEIQAGGFIVAEQRSGSRVRRQARSKGPPRHCNSPGAVNQTEGRRGLMRSAVDRGRAAWRSLQAIGAY